jgi:hypothetical protein
MSDKETVEKIVAEHSKRLIETGDFAKAQKVLAHGQILAKYLVQTESKATA